MSAPSLVALREVATIARDAVAPSEIESGTLSVGLENIESGGRFIGVGPVSTGDLASSKFRFNREHVLYGKLRPYLAKIANPDFDGVCSTDILPILPGPDLDRSYLRWLLLSPEMVATAASRAAGANLPRLSPSALQEMKIPLVPMAEQRRIAAILDKADALRAKRRAALTTLALLSESVFTGMLENTASRAVVTQLINDVADVQGGLQVTRSRDDLPRAVPYLRVANVFRGFMDLTEIKQIRLKDAEFTRTNLQKDDFLIVEGHGNSNEVGRGALWDGSIPDCVHQNHLIRVRFDSRRIVPTFAAAFLNSELGRLHLIRAGNTTSGLNTISVADVRTTPIVVPPMSVQLEFARVDKVIKSAIAMQTCGLVHLNGLFASLQHRAFRGELTG